MANKNGGFWKGYVYGLLTPLVTGIGLTLIATIAAWAVAPKSREIGGE